MHAELLVLRLVHILSAIFWLGSGLFTTFFLVPAIKGSPAVMGQVLGGLQQKRFFSLLPTAAILTILTGLRLLWIDSTGFESSYFATGTGKTYAIAGLAAFIAFLLSLLVSRPSAVRAGAIAVSLAASPATPERERLQAELDRVRRRATFSTALGVGLGILAASGMAIARYV